MQDNEWHEIIIEASEEGIRLDRVLALRFNEKYSRTYFQHLIEEEAVLLEGKPVKKRYKPTVGDALEVCFLLTPELNLEPEAIALSVLYEDDDILVVNKPPGLVVHPAPGNWSGTFVNALLYHCKEMAVDPASVRPGIVHRLDKDTSGLLLAAKSSLAQQRLIAMFASRSIHKEYLAVCLGNPGNVDMKWPIGRHPIHRKKMTVRDDGRPAYSRCQTLATDGKLSLVRIILETGRTHQIRVHMLHHGTPVLGDSVYGSAQANAKYKVNRQLLHASELRFDHPMTSQSLHFVAPLPADFSFFVDY